jgi:hypothetical protein
MPHELACVVGVPGPDEVEGHFDKVDSGGVAVGFGGLKAGELVKIKLAAKLALAACACVVFTSCKMMGKKLPSDVATIRMQM